MLTIERAGAHNVFDHAAIAGAWDEWPLLPLDVDPQVSLSRGAVGQPFHLAFDHDTLLVQMAGEALVAFPAGPVRELVLTPGDFLSVPAGLSHRVVPHSTSLHLRYTALGPHVERASFHCDGCGVELIAHSWQTGATLRQEGCVAALAVHAADAAGRACPGCGTTAPAIDVAPFRFEEVAAALRARGEAPSGAAVDAPAPPDPQRPPLVVSALWAAHLATAQSAPLFRELGPGAMVPVVGVVYGKERPFLGGFFHENSVEEVSLVVGASGHTARPGNLRVVPRSHVVKNPLPDPSDPDQWAVMAIVQRQSPASPQRETFAFRCESCDATLLERTIEFTPPTGGPIAGFDTLLLAAGSAAAFNADASVRTCRGCGTLNPPFDLDHSGWHRYVERLRVANAAAASLAAAAAPA